MNTVAVSNEVAVKVSKIGCVYVTEVPVGYFGNALKYAARRLGGHLKVAQGRQILAVNESKRADLWQVLKQDLNGGVLHVEGKRVGQLVYPCTDCGQVRQGFGCKCCD